MILIRLLIVVGIRLVATRVPFGLMHDNFPYVNISLPTLFGNTTIPFVLIPIGQSEILGQYLDDDSLWNEDDQALVFVSSQGPEGLVRFYEPQLLVDHIVGLNEMTANLGIGPDSALIESFHSVDFLTDEAQIILGSPLEQFLTTACIPGTSFSFPAASTDIMFVRTSLGGAPLRLSFTGASNVVFLPQEELSILTQIIGPDYDYRFAPIRFNDCVSMRLLLPEISLSISIGTHEDFIEGILKLYPEDYTRLHRDGSCELLIGRIHSSNQSPEISFNPLRFPHVNVRFTMMELYFCDALGR